MNESTKNLTDLTFAKFVQSHLKGEMFFDTLLNKIGRIIFTFLLQFFRPSQLKYHNERAHEEKRPHSCPQCDKSFYKKSDLRSHAKLHLGLKEYICRFCHQRFAHVSNLNRHKLTHKKEKPYSCQICGQRYNQIATLNQHCKKKHDILHKKSKTEAGSKNKVFYCKFCEKNFEHKADLDLHQVKHGQESYPYNCKRCKKGMNLVRILNNVCDTQILREIHLEPRNQQFLHFYFDEIFLSETESFASHIECGKTAISFRQIDLQ